MRAVVVLLACWAVGSLSSAGASSEPLRFPMEIDPAYARWIDRPGAMLGFWMGAPEEVRARTGSNATSGHESLYVVRSPEGRPALHPLHAGTRPWVRFTFPVPRPFTEFRVHMSTAWDGSAGAGTLFRGDAAVAEAVQENARRDPWLSFRFQEPQPAGVYQMEVRPHRGAVDVWPERIDRSDYALDDPGGQWSGPGRSLRAWVRYADGTEQEWHDAETDLVHIPMASPGPCACGGEFPFGQGVGEHNNPFFIRYPEWFLREVPEAFMQAVDGRPIGVGSPVTESTNRVPAFDDPTLTGLSSQLIRTRVGRLRSCPHLRYWVIGGEQAFPDMYGLPPGDFRPASMAHFRQFLREYGQDPSRATPSLPQPGDGAAWAAWYGYREQVVADRAATYMQVFLAGDGSRPVFYPTHGNVFFPVQRRLMGHPPALLAGACDGFETGQITIDDDPEALNLLTLNHLAAYGLPVVTPRLANKTLDPDVMGGGRSFTPEMLRRLVYECLGMGVPHIGLIQWEGDLADGLWHVKDTPAEAEAAKVFAEIEGMATVLAGMGRVQPQVGLYVSDAEWLLHRWNAAWTAFYRDALRAGWHVALVGDALIDEDLAERIPVLIGIGNAMAQRATVERLRRYLHAGGHVVTCGAFFETDELRRPITSEERPGGLRCKAVDDAFSDRESVLVNRASTAHGAHTETSTLHPVRLAKVEDALSSLVPRAVFGPLAVDGAGANVMVLPLTEGGSLAAVLINHEDTAARVALTLRGQPGREAERLRARELVTGTDCIGDGGSGTFHVPVPARGTAVAWFYAERNLEEAEASLRKAEDILRRWQGLGVDTATLERRLVQAREALEAGVPAKAAALAEAACDTLGVKLACDLVDGRPVVSAEVYDPDGGPVADARVSVRIVPGRYAWQALGPREEGGYQLAGLDLPRWYDPATTEYRQLDGPARVVCRATAGSRRGGALGVWRE